MKEKGNSLSRRRFLQLGLEVAVAGALPITVADMYSEYKRPKTPLGPDKKIYLGMTTAVVTPEEVYVREQELGIQWPIHQRYIAWGNGSIDKRVFAQYDGMAKNSNSIPKVPLITWQPWDFRAADKVNQEKYALKNIIAGNHDEYIAQNAENIKAYKKPMFLRFAPEMNGDWTPWGGMVNGNTPQEYQQAWRHVHDVFTKVGVENATWVFAPSSYTKQGYPDISAYFPGKGYVDWHGLDANNHAPGEQWQSFAELATEPYRTLTQLDNSLPVAITETASAEDAKEPNRKAIWQQEMLAYMPNDFPAVAAVVIFNREKTREGENDWRVNSSSESLAAFKKGIAQDVYNAKSVRVKNRKIIPIRYR